MHAARPDSPLFTVGMSSRIDTTVSFVTIFVLLPALVLFALAATAAAQSVPSVVISEICWMGSDLSTADEWVEFTVLSPTAVDVSGWTISSLKSSGSEGVIGTFPEGSVLQPGQVIVVSNYDRSHSRLDIDPYLVSTGMSLPNTKLLLTLRDAAGNVIDQADDGVGDPMAGSNVSGQPKATMERIDLMASGRAPSNWKTADNSVNFDMDSSMKGTPGVTPIIASSSSAIASSEREALPLSSSSDPPSSDAQNSSSAMPFSSASLESSSQDSSSSAVSSVSSASSGQVLRQSLYVSEILPNPVGADDNEWIEIASEDTLNLLPGWSVSDGTRTFPLPAGESVTPDRPFLLSHAQTGLVLGNAEGSVTLSFSGAVVDTLSYSSTVEGVSIGRTGPGEAAMRFCIPTPGTPNKIVQPDIEPQLQSGEWEGQDHVTFNMQLTALTGTLSGAKCVVDFGDGAVSSSCNPTSHTISQTGDYTIHAEVQDVCGNTIIREWVAKVTEAEDVSDNQISYSTTAASSSEESSQGDTFGEAVQGEIHLVSALPNPAGKDTAQTEKITLQNLTQEPLRLDSYSLLVSGKTVSLSGQDIGAGEERSFAASDLHTSLKNTDGSVELDYGVLKEAIIAWSDAGEGNEYHSLPPDLSHMEGTVVRTIDGDTIVVDLGQPFGQRTIRLRGIDAPEIASYAHAAQPYADMAKEFIGSLISNKKIELQFDTEVSDPYGRTLAYVHLADGTDVQISLLKAGLARVVGHIPFSCRDSYEQTQEQAQKQGMGLWSGTASSSFSSEQELIQEASSAAEEASAQSSFEISEIYPSPKKGEQEWIEVHNLSAEPADLSGYILSEQSGSKEHHFVVHTTLIVPADGLATLRIGTGSLKLNNGGQAVTLKDPDGNKLDDVSYPAVKTGFSYSLLAGQWCLSDPTPGSENHCLSKKQSAVKKKSAASSVLLATSFAPAYLKTLFINDQETADSGTALTGSGTNSLYTDLSAQLIDQSTTAEDTGNPWSPWISGIVVVSGGIFGLRKVLTMIGNVL